MSTRRFTVTIACPRLFFEAGDPAQCECDVQVECEADGIFSVCTWDSLGETPELEIVSVPQFCTHTDDKMDVAYTAVEYAEAVVRAEAALDAFDVMELAYE